MANWLGHGAGLAAAALLLAPLPGEPASAAIVFDRARVLAIAGDVQSFELVDALPIQASPSVVSADGLAASTLSAATVGGPDGIGLVARGSVSVQPGGPPARAEYTVFFCVEDGTAAPAFSQSARVAIDPADVDLTGNSLISTSFYGFDTPGVPGSGEIHLNDGAGQPEVTLDTEGQLNLGFGDYTCELGNRGAVSGLIEIALAAGALAQTATAEFEIEVIVGDASLPPTGSTEYRWVGGRSGAFADADNWEPPGVPAFIEDERSDTALVEGGRNVTIDLAAGALSRVAGTRGALGPRTVVRRVGRLVVRDSNGLRTEGGRLEADALSPDLGARSLEVGADSQLLLDGGHLVARHAALGVDGEGEIEVLGPAASLETVGRLGLGASGDGRLFVHQGGQVTSAEAVLGELEAAGTAIVQDAGSLWRTANLAVGLERDATLEIQGGARVESDQAFVDFEVEAGERASASLEGRDAEGNRATWSVESLTVGKRGTVSVRDGGFLDVAGSLLLASGGAGEESFVQVRGGGQLAATSVDIRGLLLVASEALALVVQSVAVGESGVAESAGTLMLSGHGAKLDGPSELRVESRGDAVLLGGAEANLFGTFAVGIDQASDSRLRVFAGSTGTGEASLLRATASAPAFSVVGAFSDAPVSVAWPWTGELVLEGGRIELAGPDHSLRVERRGVLTGRGGTLSIAPPGRLFNRGHVQGGFTLEGSYEQAPGSSVFGQILSPGGTPINRSALAPLAAADFPRRAVRAKSSPPGFGPLVVTGDATLGGSLTLQFGNGVAPRAGESFAVLDAAGQVTGEFDEVSIRGLVPGSFAFEPSLVGGKLALTSMTDAVALPAVSVKAKAKLKETAKKGGKVKLVRTGDTSAPLVVGYAVRGSAQSGLDYEALAGAIEIPARKRSATIVVRPLADGLVEGPETIELELLPDETFAPGAVSRATIELLSRDG